MLPGKRHAVIVTVVKVVQSVRLVDVCQYDSTACGYREHPGELSTRERLIAFIYKREFERPWIIRSGVVPIG